MAKNDSYAPLNGYGYAELNGPFISLANEGRWAFRTIQNQIEAARKNINENTDHKAAILSAHTTTKAEEIKNVVNSNFVTTNAKIDAIAGNVNTVKSWVESVKNEIGSQNTQGTMAYYVKQLFNRP